MIPFSLLIQLIKVFLQKQRRYLGDNSAMIYAVYYILIIFQIYLALCDHFLFLDRECALFLGTEEFQISIKKTSYVY